jgi:hypothetical protein
MNKENCLEEKIVKLKTIVYKKIVDPSIIKLIGEQEKLNLFTKIGLIKPKKEEIQFIALKTFYEPFFIVKGRYYIDYYRRKKYHLTIEDDVKELLVFENVLKSTDSKISELRGKQRSIELSSEQRIIKEKSDYIILDFKGQEVELEKFPVAPSEEEIEKILSKEDIKKSEISPEKAIKILRKKIVDKPKDVDRIQKELFEVTEHTLIYIPIYQSFYKNIKNQSIKSIIINGVSSKLLHKNDINLTNEYICSKCGKVVVKYANFCRSCGNPLMKENKKRDKGTKNKFFEEGLASEFRENIREKSLKK